MLRRSDESAWTIIQSRPSTIIFSTTSRRSVESGDFEYRPLGFENDLFTARVYKRSFVRLFTIQRGPTAEQPIVSEDQSRRPQRTSTMKSQLAASLRSWRTASMNSEQTSSSFSRRTPSIAPQRTASQLDFHQDPEADTDETSIVSGSLISEEVASSYNGSSIMRHYEESIISDDAETIRWPSRSADHYEHAGATTASSRSTEDTTVVPIYSVLPIDEPTDTWLLNLAASQNRWDILDKILATWSPDDLEAWKTRTFFDACVQGNEGVVQFMLDRGMSVHRQTSGPGVRWRAIHLAVSSGRIAAVKVLLDAGASVNDTSSQGHRPLNESVSQGNVSMTAFLLQAGAVVSSRALILRS